MARRIAKHRRQAHAARLLAFTALAAASSHAGALRAQTAGPPPGVTTAPASPGAGAPQAPLTPKPSGSSGPSLPAPSLPASSLAAPPLPAPPKRVEAAGASAAATCIERIPEGKTRPSFKDTFPSKGTSGHAATLSVVVQHLKGEEVLPGGFRIADGDALKTLEKSHLALPDPLGAAAPKITRSPEGTETRVEIYLLPLPPEPGRHELTLPPLPISIARANGQVITVCTKPHLITVEDPIANTPEPKPRLNPAARRQEEPWQLLKQLVFGGLAALVLGVIVGYLISRWRRRERPVPPPPPPRPPWEVAIEELHDIRHAGLVRNNRYSEHYDRVSDTIRKYLGERFGFDGLESTTREALAVLGEISPPIEPIDKVRAFLRQADLVKFARLTPTEEECELALGRGEEIVRNTMPRELAAPGATKPARSE